MKQKPSGAVKTVSVLKQIKSGYILGGCSQIGEYHSRCGKPNQDQLMWGSYRSGFVFVAVADGVGSCKFAERGAFEAVNAIKRVCQNGPDWLQDSHSASRLRKYIVSSWQKHVGKQQDDSCSTLNFVIVGPRKVWLGQVGDGLILGRIGRKFYVLEDVNAIAPYTVALGSTVEENDFRLLCLPKKKNMMIFLASDGVGRLLNRNLWKEFVCYIRKICSKPSRQARNEIEQWMEELNVLNGDDKTLGVFLCK